MLMPGDHLVDNRPGLIPTTTNTYLNRNGSTTNDFPAFNSSTNFDLNSVNNQLYKLNNSWWSYCAQKVNLLLVQI